MPNSPMTPQQLKRKRELSRRRKTTGERAYNDNTDVRKHIEMLMWHGWSLARIGRAAGVHDTTIHDQVYRYTVCHEDTRAFILGVTLEEGDEPGLTGYGRMLGAHRIIKALGCQGWTVDGISKVTGINRWNLRRYAQTPIPGRNVQLSIEAYKNLRSVAQKVEVMDPQLDGGVTPQSSSWLSGRNLKDGHAPLPNWDLDTIHLVDSFPDWTGECGTVQGYFLHLKTGIKVTSYDHGSKTDPHKVKRRVLCEACRSARSASVVTYRKWDDAAQQDMLKLIDEGVTVRKVAKQFGCSERTIERFKKERRLREAGNV